MSGVDILEKKGGRGIMRFGEEDGKMVRHVLALYIGGLRAFHWFSRRYPGKRGGNISREVSLYKPGCMDGTPPLLTSQILSCYVYMTCHAPLCLHAKSDILLVHGPSPQTVQYSGFYTCPP